MFDRLIIAKSQTPQAKGGIILAGIHSSEPYNVCVANIIDCSISFLNEFWLF